jgi:molecular chaperone GrpE
MALFKRGKSDTDEVEGDSAESTIEVKASVIADAERAAAARQAGIGADGLVSVSDLAGDPAEPAEPAPDPRLDQALAERRTLVQLCLYALDRARSPGVVERLEEGLAGVGVTSLRPDGIRFDPAFHEAGGTVATTDEELDGVVAETELVGFSDRGEVLRAPIVTVYSKAAP